MPRETLDRHIHQLQDEILLLGSMVEQATLDAMDALKRRDPQTARRVMTGDSRINDKRYAIENAIIICLATQQPMAHDLRTLAAFLEVSTELERIGDYAKGIANVVIRLGETDIPIPMREFEQMAELSLNMLHRALGAFINEDATIASQIPLEDNRVDELYIRVYRILISNMIADPETIDHANLLLWVDHNLERLADRVTNICERTVFVATGELLEFEPEDNEAEVDV
jgi:phosphate transport system protein